MIKPLKAERISDNVNAKTSPALTLVKRRGSSDFEQLRKTMVDAVQKLAASRWTDYNLHDPGITILESLCYALTDINHRTDYAIENLLADENHELGLRQHGLSAPNDAFQMRPLTATEIADYLCRKIPELASASIQETKVKTKASEVGCTLPWLHKIYVTAWASSNSSKQMQELKAKVVTQYHRVRNLGNALYAVVPTKRVNVALSGDIYLNEEVGESGKVEQALAAMYFCVLSYLVTAKFHGTGEPMVALLNEIHKVPGVVTTSHLALIGVTADGRLDKPVSSSVFADPRYALRLQLSTIVGASAMRVFVRNRQVSVDAAGIQELIHSLEEAHQLQRRMQRDAPPTESIAAPHKELLSYISVQNHFPANYGINAFGLPASASPQRKGQAKQLKGYLTLFDQLLVDHLAMLDSIKTFLSTDTQVKRVYPTGKLDGFVAQIYQSSPGIEFLDSLEAYQNYSPRKARVLDFLAAMNGRDKESFAWDFNNPYFSELARAEQLLACKQQYVENIGTLARDRAAGTNFVEKTWGTTNQSTLEKHVRIKLGLSERRLSTVYPLVRAGLNHQEGDLGFHFNANNAKQETRFATSFYENIGHSLAADETRNLRPVPGVSVDEPTSKKVYHQVRNHVFGHLKNLRTLLFRAGANLASYRIKVSDQNSITRLYINLGRGSRENWLYLVSTKSEHDAAITANGLCQFIQTLNSDMEGFHLLEHQLLLPVSKDWQPAVDKVASINPFANTQSLVVAGWSARFVEAEFRRYVEDLVLQESPAHMYTQVFWLDFSTMERFEVLFKNWCDVRVGRTDHRKFNFLSAKLLRMLTKLAEGGLR
ncbi:hypothetical protein [Teredinibacter turnerae]|uniref:hypothetical protein n=1 Tax=Teredinibacter turnerae TaxID=2426 RepID=UPI0003769F76|nr:hypothetical protein [Teredinibacter turnerae]